MDAEQSDAEIRAALIAEIERAFGDVRRGNGITLHQARVLDDYGNEQEQAEARKSDTDTRWQSIPDSWIENLCDTLAFLDPEGFRYYIPAFMIWALKYHDTSASFAVDAAVYILCLEDGKLRAWQLERYRLLAKPQAIAIAHFLDYCAHQAHMGNMDDAVAKEALDAHWGQFL